jgi:outer membrane assembly lipoprotein YfiO
VTRRGPRQPRLARLLAILPAAALLVACGASAPPLPADVTDPARVAYHKGMARLVAGDYLQATEIFQTLAASPRHVRHATLARLRHGDSLFLEGRYAEATEIYRSFVNQHRGDPNLAYARFRVAAAYFKRLPTEWFLSPPAHEMDQTLTQQTEMELNGFISLFPTSPYTAEARGMLTATRRMLLAHERYAARFYVARKAWTGVVERLLAAFDRFPELVDEPLGWTLVEAAERAASPARSVQALAKVLERFPESPRRAELERRLTAAQAALKAAESAPAAESDDALPETLDAPPDFRLKLPDSVAPDGDAEGEEGDEDDADDAEGEDDAASEGDTPEDDEAPPKLRPPSVPRLAP